MLFFNEPHFSWRKSLDFVETIQYGGKMFFFFYWFLFMVTLACFTENHVFLVEDKLRKATTFIQSSRKLIFFSFHS